MRLIPIMVLVTEATHDHLRPTVDKVAALLAETDLCKSPAAVLNGWTPERLAWGKVLDACTEVDLDIIDHETGEPTP